MKSVSNQLELYFVNFYQYQTPLPKYHRLVKNEWKRVVTICGGRRSRRTYIGLWNGRFSPIFTINYQIRLNS
mgnify:CR=1 FL=1